MITKIFNTEISYTRKLVSEHIINKKKNDRYTVLDIGGLANRWADGVADYYVDLLESPDKNVIAGDICAEETWHEINKIGPDFVICTHVLEDIRDPGFVMRKINELNISGFISFPTFQSELSFGMQSNNYLGWAHHRWILSITDKPTTKIILFPKLPQISCGKKQDFLSKLYTRSDKIKSILRGFNFTPKNIGFSPLIDYNFASNKLETGFIFKGIIPFEYANNDLFSFDRTEMEAVLLDTIIKP